MNALLVGNPTAQSGKAAGRIQRSVDAMRARGWTADVLETLPGGATVEALRRRLDDDDAIQTVVYLGGDGTFAEVAKGVLAARRPRIMGMLPSGTANDQGKSFGISAAAGALEANLAIIEAGHVTQLDVGRVGRVVEGRVDALETFFHSVGWGMQPDILAQRNKDRQAVQAFPLLREIYRDQLVYAGAALEKLLESYVEPTKFDAFVTVDGHKRHLRRLTDLVINATPVYGGNWVLDRRAEPDDGKFELVAIGGRREWASKALMDLRNNPVTDADLRPFGVEHFQPIQGSEFDVELVHSKGDVDVASQMDGEEWVSGVHFKVTVLARTLPVYSPAGWQPPWRS
jgi:diacylglycerol kinase family enzyme